MAQKFEWGTTGDEVVKEFADIIKGKTILITGVASNTLGGETAVALSKAQPKLLLLHARSEDKIAPIAKEVQDAGVPTKSVLMNLASLASVRKAAENLISEKDITIDVLINCAGIMATPYGKTEDGFEQQFGVNHLSHFLFTNLLVKGDKIPSGGRIVNVSSAGHRRSPIRWDDINFSDGETYEKYTSYGQSKTANILYSLTLADRLRSKNILCYSVHPGIIWTNLGRHLTTEELEGLIAAAKKTLKEQDAIPEMKSLNQGVGTQIVAGFSPLIVEQNGGYLADCQITPANPHATSLDDANRLWGISEEMVGEKFAF
ncbi:hypothetical protein TWF694_002634 [Orbilia ellipsospora]|uniref:NAD(P)-binding protein n=1 Tax=Orbilia ellipsospora TaxID=2528407 RepID=A0AAV9X3T4_9PEZI